MHWRASHQRLQCGFAVKPISFVYQPAGLQHHWFMNQGGVAQELWDLYGFGILWNWNQPFLDFCLLFRDQGNHGGRGVLSFHRSHRWAGGRGLRIMKKAGLAHDLAGWLVGTVPAAEARASTGGGVLSALAGPGPSSPQCATPPLAAVPSPKDSSICPLATSRFWVVSVPTEGWAIAVLNRVSLPGISPGAALSCPAVLASPSGALGKPQ